MKFRKFNYYRILRHLPALLLLCSGCIATVPINAARRDFSNGQLDRADQHLTNLPNDQDKVLHLMERGMIRHLLRDYTNSTTDWRAAVHLERELETHSITKAGASMVMNDSSLAFRGYPYERVYLHVYLAKNYLAMGLWEEAAVEARNIALRMQKLDGFPDDAFSRYLAGFCLELCGDDSNAALQYRQASKLVPECRIDGATGRFLPESPPTQHSLSNDLNSTELVCFLDLAGSSGLIPHSAVISANGQVLGTGRTLTSLHQLQSASNDRMATRHAMKTLARLAFKGALAITAASRDEDLGLFTWLLLLALEEEDLRRWETLPGKLAVARVPCPADLTQFEVEFKSYSGHTIGRKHVVKPLKRKGRILVSLCRDYP